MNVKRRRRLFLVISIVMGMGLTMSLVLFALNKNINLYYSPSEITKSQLPQRHLRLGGLVKKGSLSHKANTLKICFIITDLYKDIKVQYTGIVPNLFREGQGVVVEGRFEPNGIFIANQVLAKHDEKYMPPGIKK